MEKVKFPEIGEYKDFEKVSSIAKDYGIDLESMAGKEVELPKELAEKLSQLGIAKESEKENEEIENDENDIEKDDEEIEEGEEKEEKKRKEYGSVKERVKEILPKLSAYNALPAKEQALIMDAYDRPHSDIYYWEFDRDDFLEKYVNTGDKSTALVNTRELHNLVRGAIVAQDHMSEVTENESLPQENVNIEAPKILNDLEPYVKAEAKEEMKKNLKEIIYAAISARPINQNSLIILRDIKDKAKDLQADLGDASTNNEFEEAKKSYISSMETSDIADVIEEVKKNVDGNVTLWFNDIDWTEPAQRANAMKMLHQIQQETGKGVDGLVDKIQITFNVDNKEDIKEVQEASSELNALKIPVVANIETSGNEELAEEAQAVYDGTEQSEQKEEKEEEKNEEEEEKEENELGEIAGLATEEPEVMRGIVHGIAREVAREIPFVPPTK